jgi:aminopeptidase N
MKKSKWGIQKKKAILMQAILFVLLLPALVSFSQNNNSLNSRDLSYLTSGGKLHPLQAIMDIRHYTIVLDVDIENKSIKGSAEVSLNLSKKTDTLLLDLIHLYTVTKVKVNNKSVAFLIISSGLRTFVSHSLTVSVSEILRPAI